MKSLIVAAVTVLFIQGCATAPEKIEAKYVSPLLYQSYNCEQLALELRRIGTKTQSAITGQKSEANKDAAVMGVGFILFWPALLFFANDEDRGEELAQLKGEMETMEHVAIQKKCSKLLAQITEEREAAKKRAELLEKNKLLQLDPVNQ